VSSIEAMAPRELMRDHRPDCKVGCEGARLALARRRAGERA
jgi:hypothetical protein